MPKRIVPPALLAIGLAITTLACLVKETNHVLYLSPDGALTWSVTEANVRSAEEDLAKRIDEERDYLKHALAGDDDVTRALASLAPCSAHQVLVRDQRPFTHVSAAGFERIDVLADEILRRLGVPGDARFEVDGSTRRFVLTFRVGDLDDAEVGDDGDALGPLWEGTDENLSLATGSYRFVLTDGRFTAVDGFRIEDDRATAVPMRVDDRDAPQPDAAGNVTYTLTWEVW